eukprot:gene1175-10689_t
MTKSARLAKIKSDEWQKKGKLSKEEKEEKKNKDDAPAVSPFILGMFLFVVVGSVIFQIFQNARNAATYGVGAQYEG